MTRRVLLVVLGVLVMGAGAAGLGAYWYGHSAKDLPTVTTKAPARKPTLYCDFYNFMHNATVASFYFAVELGDGAQAPKYSELYVVENEGQKTDFGGPDQPPAPQWSYAIEDGTPTISSPDGETRIVLYGLKPKVGGVFWIEAGVRSIAYRNLEGKCRQAHYARSASNGKP